MRLLADLEQSHIVQGVRLLVHGEQIHRLLAWFGQHAETCRQCSAVIIVDGSLPNVGKHAQQPAIVLTVLFGQVADDAIKLIPYQRFGDEPFRVPAQTGVPFTGCHEFRGRRDHIMIAVGCADRRQLEEITANHNLQPTERARVEADPAAHLIDHVEQPGMHHRHFVDDEDVSRLQFAFASRANRCEQTLAQRGGQADAAPRVDGLTVDMRGGDARGCGDSDVRALLTSRTHEFVEHVGFACTGGTCEEHVRPGVQNGQRFRLLHISPRLAGFASPSLTCSECS